MLAQRIFAGIAIRFAVFGDGEHAVGARQPREQRPIELVRQRVQLDGVRDGFDHLRGQESHHCGHDAREIRIAPTEIGAAVEVVLEECDRGRVARIGGEIRIRVVKTPCLPVAQARERPREGRIRMPCFVESRDSRKLACQRRGCCDGVARVGHARKSSR